MTVGLGFSAGDTLGDKTCEQSDHRVVQRGDRCLDSQRHGYGRAVSGSPSCGHVLHDGGSVSGSDGVLRGDRRRRSVQCVGTPRGHRVRDEPPPVVTTSVVGPIVTAGNPPVTLDANVTIIDGSASLSGGTVTVGLGFSAG